MVTDMDTATDMAMIRRTKRNKSYLLGCLLWCNFGFAADTTITPSVEGGITYTDNMDLSATNEKSTEITSMIAGVKLESKGNDGNASLDYSIEQLYYSKDSSKNELYQELSLDADKGLLLQNRLRGNVSASITNIASDITDNASNDVSRGDTIENKSASVGFSYQTNPDGMVNLDVRVEGTVDDYEDNIGNNNSYSGQLYFAQGRSVKRYFWTTNYTYKETLGRNNAGDTSSLTLDQEIGLQPVHNLSPYVHVYYEDYSGQSVDDSADSSSWGPGVKYYLDRNSYLSVGYDFALDDESSDHWRSSIVLIPTDRTRLQFDYTQRFFGDAYEFSLSHRNRRWNNEISYTEEVTNYERDLFVAGNRIEDLSLSKQLTWNSSLELRRTTLSLDISADNQQALRTLSAETETDIYSVELSVAHNLSRKTTATPSFLFENYDFQREGSTYQKDYYRDLAFELEHDFAEEFSASMKLSHRERSSNNVDSEYQENRIYVNVRKEF